MATTEAIDWIHRLAESVTTAAEQWDEVAIERALDSRDTDPFDSEWVRTDRALRARMTLASPSARLEIEACANDLRTGTHIAILRATGSPDLAAYVSDDFEMICNGLASGFADDFLFSLVGAYLDGRIPDNAMPVVRTNPSGLYA